MMPRRAMKPCSVPGCAELVQSGAYCTTHQPAHKREDNRESASQRGYDAKWRRLRSAILAGNPICADPFRLHSRQVVLATDVDHILAKREGGRDEKNNLQPLCHACHSRKTIGGA